MGGHEPLWLKQGGYGLASTLLQAKRLHLLLGGPSAGAEVVKFAVKRNRLRPVTLRLVHERGHVHHGCRKPYHLAGRRGHKGSQVMTSLSGVRYCVGGHSGLLVSGVHHTPCYLERLRVGVGGVKVLQRRTHQFTRFDAKRRKAATHAQANALGVALSAAWGTVWKLSEQVDTDALPRLPRVVASVPTQSRRYRPLDDAPPPGDLINVVDSLGRHFLSDHPQLYTQAEARFDTRQAGFEVNYLSWVKTVGKGAAGARYSSSGSWKAVDYQRREYAPTFFYWISLDVDRGYFPEDAWEAARSFVKSLHLWGVDLGRIAVSYTGGRGFHIRIPAGMAGNPIFSSPSSARRVLSKFARLLTGGEEVDECVFDPRQQLRMIGSRHDSSGLYCNAFSGEEFLAFRSFWDVLSACSVRRIYEPFDPRLEIECPSLVDLMLEASEMASAPTASRLPKHGEQKAAPDMLEAGGGSVIKAALEGCAEGEIWHEARGERVFEGRSKLLFVAACEMLRRHGLGSDVAWLGLCEVNDLCTPPLSQTDLRHRYRSAIRSVERELSIKQGGGKPR